MPEVCCSSLQAGLGSLTALKSLETLQIRGYKGDGEHSGDIYGQALLDCLPLELENLPLVRSVALTGITPYGMHVRNGCRVHVGMSGYMSARHPLWHDLSSDSVRSLPGTPGIT